MKVNQNLVYPILISNINHQLLVRLPDFSVDAHICQNENDAINWSQQVILSKLSQLDIPNYPKPSSLYQLGDLTQQKLIYISVNQANLKQPHAKTIRKNLTIPEYLNNLALQHNLNMSQFLTDALKTKFGC